jgi:hypothetical protein
MLTIDQLNRLQNHGFTSQGAAIVDAIWFSQFGGPQIGMVLICNPAGVWKAYLGLPVITGIDEAHEAKQIAEAGSKVPYAIAKAAFPTRDFDNTNYDLTEVQVQDA